MAQLITAAEVITIAITNKNLNVSLVGDHFIEIAQQEHIRPALASGELDAVNSLYEEIVDQNNTATLTAANQTLLDDYIKPCLAFYVKFEIINDMMMNTTSAGIQVLTTDNSQPATDAQRAAIKATAFSHANTLRDKMLMFLEDTANFANYPKYTRSNSISNFVSKRGGIVMGNDFEPTIDNR